MAKDFFISRTGADKQGAQWIVWKLEEEGYEVVLQDWNFHAGESFVRNMQKASAEYKRTIAVLSPDYFKSQYTASEWEAAFTNDPLGEQGLLIPVIVRKCEITGLLTRLPYISVVGLSEEQAKDLLISLSHTTEQNPILNLFFLEPNCIRSCGIAEFGSGIIGDDPLQF